MNAVIVKFCRLCIGAAQLVSQGESRVTAAIASSRAAQLYGLQVLDEGIQDKADNFTRFIVLSRYTSAHFQQEQLSGLNAMEYSAQILLFYIRFAMQRSISKHGGRMQAMPIQDISCLQLGRRARAAVQSAVCVCVA